MTSLYGQDLGKGQGFSICVCKEAYDITMRLE